MKSASIEKTHELRTYLPDWNKAVGLDQHIRSLSEAFSSSYMHPVVLLHGPKGMGKRHLANWIAARFFCEMHSGCGVCPSCKEVMAGMHPDVLIMDARESTSIKTSEVETLQKELSILSPEGFRVAIITECDRMTPEAANRMLKLLEEPPEQVRIIMTTSKIHALLPTVAGRCLKWGIGSPTVELVRDWFRKFLKLEESKSKDSPLAISSGCSEEELNLWIRRHGKSPGELVRSLGVESSRNIQIAKKIRSVFLASRPLEVIKISEEIVKGLNCSASEILEAAEWELNSIYHFDLDKVNQAAIMGRRAALSKLRRLVTFGKISLNAQFVIESIGLVPFRSSEGVF